MKKKGEITMEREIGFVLPNGQDLKSPYDLSASPIKAAQPLTVSITTVYVNGLFEDGFRKGNDILVLTQSSLETQPPVRRIHYYEEDIPTKEAKEPICNMFGNNVFVTDDYDGETPLCLEVNVVEVDRDLFKDRQKAIKEFQSLALTAGAVFPVALPYIFAASAASGLIETLVSVLEKDKNIVKVPLKLYPGKPERGKAPLQCGTYVFFDEPHDLSKYKLRQDGVLEPSDVSYAVLNVFPKKAGKTAYVINQKIATLLTQMEDGNRNSDADTIHFLNDTLTQYSNFKKLNRYQELLCKESRTASEESLIKEIQSIDALKPFLPAFAAVHS